MSITGVSHDLTYICSMSLVTKASWSVIFLKLYMETCTFDLVFCLPGLLEERALLLGRMGKHEQALFIYVHILKDTHMAEE